jgi:hypothetical protein
MRNFKSLNEIIINNYSFLVQISLVVEPSNVALSHN